MPQLDIITFFNQFFWLTIFFVFFYFYIFKSVVPFLTRIIKIRFKKITSTVSFVSNIKNHELISVSTLSDSFMIKTLSKIYSKFNMFQTSIDSWCNSGLIAFQKNTNILNQRFLSSLVVVSSQPFIFTKFFVKKKLVF